MFDDLGDLKKIDDALRTRPDPRPQAGGPSASLGITVRLDDGENAATLISGASKLLGAASAVAGVGLLLFGNSKRNQRRN